MPLDDSYLRVAVFLFALLLLFLVQWLLPARAKGSWGRARVQANAFLFIAGIVMVKLLGPLVALNVALIATEHNMGLLHSVDFPSLIEFFIALLLLDAAIYLQHFASHKIPWLWRFHRVHHADQSIDVTTALRFHPVEIGLSMLYKSAIVCCVGASWWAVLLFEILLNASAMFNHANIRLRNNIDRVLRHFLVTPDMHLVHHSKDSLEQNSNYGFCLSIWDKMLGSYRSVRQDDSEVNIGLSQIDKDTSASFRWVLLSPFTSSFGAGRQ